MNNEIRAQKNFNLATVGGVGLMLTGACAVIGLWLMVTGDRVPGALLIAAAAMMLHTAYLAFSRIRPRRPELGSWQKGGERR